MQKFMSVSASHLLPADKLKRESFLTPTRNFEEDDSPIRKTIQTFQPNLNASLKNPFVEPSIGDFGLLENLETVQETSRDSFAEVQLVLSSRD